MARRTKAEAKETKKAILEAAERVFYRQGVAGTSLMDIANEAGVTRGAIYWHFKNKQDVFAAMICRRQLPMEALVDEVRTNDGRFALEKLHQHFVHTLRQAAQDEQHRQFYVTVLLKCEMNDENALLLERQQQIFNSVGAKIALILEHAIKAGDLPAELNIEKAVPFLQSSITGLLFSWLLSPESFDLYHYAEGYVSTLLGGLQFSPAFIKKMNEEKA